MSAEHTPANDHTTTEFEVARLAGQLAQEVSADYAIKCLTNIANALRPMATEEQIAPHRIARIALDIATKHGITVADLRGHDRRRKYAWPRQEAFATCYALRQPGRDTPFSLTSIGTYFGNRDHATVHHGIRAHEDRAERGLA